MGYVLYSTAIAMLLRIEAVEDVILGTNFSSAFSPVVFIMQMLYLKSLYDDSLTTRLFYTLIAATRSMTLKLGAYVHGERRCADKIRAGELKVLYNNTKTSSRHPVEDCAPLIDTVRGLLMVYTRYEFKIFGVQDPRNDYMRFKFDKEEQAAKDVFAAIIMNDEEDTSVFDGAQFEMISVLTQLRERGVFAL